MKRLFATTMLGIEFFGLLTFYQPVTESLQAEANYPTRQELSFPFVAPIPTELVLYTPSSELAQK